MSFYQPVMKYRRTLAVVVLILVLCLIPSRELARIDLFKFSYEDLVVHLIMFVAFSILLYRDLRKNRKIPENQSFLPVSVLSLSLLLGLLTEFLQFFFTALNRSASLTDLIFDFAGASLGITYMRFIRR